MVRFAAVGACALMLAGCGAGAQYAMSEYSGVEVKSFALEGDDIYRVFDKPASNKLMITPSFGKAMMAGAAQGATFGAVDAMDTIGPKPMFERATVEYLKSTGRTCRIVDGYVVIKPQWEFKYDCSLPVAETQPAAKQKR